MGIIETFVNKCLSLDRLGKKWCNEVIQGIIEAGRTISYVETYNPSQSDSLHLAIKNSGQRTFMHEFERVVWFAIAKLGLKRVKIAFDSTEDLTWSKYSFNLRPSVYDPPLMGWNYLNVSIVDPYFIPLMSIPYRQVDNLDLLVIDLLEYIRGLPIIVDLVLFDRGFYHAHLIDYMNNKKGGKPWPYLMLVKETASVKKYIQETKSFGYFKHLFKYSKEKSTYQPSTTIIVLRINDNTCWCYATNQTPSINLIREYKKRWNIETGFRIHDEAKIKSKSNNYLIRFFYHLIGMLFILLWRLQNTICIIVFKRYLKQLEQQFNNHEIKLIDPT
jgi:hypothetical protein